MPRGTKRNADKISDNGKDAGEGSNSEVETAKSRLEKDLQKMRDEAEEKRMSVLNAYLKENEGKVIKVTKPPAKKERVMKFIDKSPEPPAKKVAKMKTTPTPKSPTSKKVPAAKVAKVSIKATSTTSSSSSSTTKPAAKPASISLPKKLTTLDHTQLLMFLQSEIELSPVTVSSLKKDKLNGKYLRGLWAHRNELGAKDRIASIFERLFPVDRDFAQMMNLLSSSNLRI